ncbi:NAD(P)/FAD-dependent oxidoreductase [Halanaeroarchaeum sulfurireducens]|uniref:Protoporphyrinogen oxidase n=1 Tax=Halanaeroarchaeum sulfurireducens TaxID=1604004 RepID=A0A0F7PGB5_9EURY|nr:NAD(P)/FAD-dependent oxidoreductase [Halanaeroarchaeum sulfurireducens]AKH98338.1 protoporphyrinogen oxidase [Halanaeroarchaeum sulfurireducens]ALG82732.1 protoporphyrinogen oxidase [Halanaeroarchaeum sulfurireducens]
MIAIVGGGLAGLAAAYRLQRRGESVHVYERAETVGGLAATYETAGDPIEKYYHHLSATEETIVDLIEELGLGDDLRWPIGGDAYYVDGVVHPLDTAWEIAAYPHLSLYDKFRLGMLVLGVDVRGGIPSRSSYERLEDYEDVPIRAFVLEHTTRGVYEHFFEPLLDAKFGSRKDDVSAAWLLGRVRFRGERDLLRGEPLGYLDGGFGRLTDALVDAIGDENVTTNASVTDVETAEDAVTGVGVAIDGERRRVDADAVVLATMPDVLEGLTGYQCAIEFQGTVCSVVSLSESLTDTYWLNIADEAPFGALIEHTNYVDESHYGGEHLLYVPKYVQSTDDEVWQMDDEAVEALWLDGIEALFPDFDRASVNWIRTARNPKTAPVYERGYLETVVPYDLSDAMADGVYYAGMGTRAQYPERSLDGAVVAGFTVADRISG